MRRFTVTVFISLLLAALTCSGEHPDSSAMVPVTISKKYRLSLTALYSRDNNWNNSDNSNLSMVFNGECRYMRSSPVFTRLFLFQSAAGYIRTPDSTWIKNTDRLRLFAMITRRSGAYLQRSFNANVSTQMLNTWTLKNNLPVRTASFFNPGSVMLSYGLTRTFRSNSFITINFSSLRIATKPRYSYTDIMNEAEAKSKKSFWFCDYGFNITASADEMINPFVQWQCDLVSFANGLRSDQLNADLRNVMTFFICKYIMLKIESGIIYNPLISKKLQYQNSVLVGLVIDKGWKGKG